jgi:hypothetical protein
MRRFARSPLARLVLLPLAIYLGCFIILTWPAISRFSTHFWCDPLDGLQNVWNLWWVRHAVVELHQSPWHTNWLHYPHGTTLIGHTLNPFNGFLGIALGTLLSPTQVYNLILMMTFVAGGVFGFLLARHLTGSYWPSIVAGYGFTFSHFHFAHAQGHLQLASLQFVPLFLLAFVRLIEAPSVWRGVSAGVVLGLVALCDYYYTFFCMVTAGMAVLWNLPVLKRAHLVPLAAFTAATVLCLGPLLATLFATNARDPLVGAHPVEMFSCDLPALLIPGGHWGFGWITRWHWSKLPGNIEEHSVYVGSAGLGLAVFGWLGARRSAPRTRSPTFLLAVAVVFAVLSLGPAVRAFGGPLTGPILPYAWLQEIVPPLKLAGVPVRMMVMTILAVSVLAAYGLTRLWAVDSRVRAVAGVALVCVMVLELWPRGLALTAPQCPDWVAALRHLPDNGGVLIDLAETDTRLLYFQTIYRKPQALGYVSRAPRSVVESNDRLLAIYRAGQHWRLRDELKFRYIVTGSGMSLPLPKVYSGEDAIIYELATFP